MPMGSPLMNKIIKHKNDRKTQIVVGGVLLVISLIFIGLIVAKHHHKNATSHKTQSSAHLEPFEQIAEFNQSATGEAIGNLQTSQSSSSTRITKLESQNKKLILQNHSFSDQLKNMNKLMISFKKKVDTHNKKQNSLNSTHTKQPRVVNLANAMQSNTNAFGKPQTLDQNNINSNAGISDFTYLYSHKINAQDSQKCTPKNCVLPGTFAKAVLLGAADANASVNGQSNTTPILFKILGDGILPNGYHSHLSGCFVVGEVYGDISSERGEVKLAQISCVIHGKTITKAINGTAYFLGKEGIRGKPVMRNGQLLWNAGVAGMLNGLAQGVQQAATSQSISPLGQTSTVPASKIGMAMGAGGIQSAANTLANYYVKRADQYHPIIELNAGTVVNLVFLNKFLLSSNHQSNGALVTQHQSNHYWKSSNAKNDTGKNNLNDYHYDESVSSDHITHIQQQINALGDK